MRILIGIVLILMIGCAQNKEIPSPALSKAPEQPQPEVSIEDRIYFLQHKLIARWVFNSDGAFFFDLKNGGADQLYSAATEVVNNDYANEILISPVQDADAVLLEFPQPTTPGQCFFVLIEKIGDSFAYYTYEKTFSFGDAEIAGVLGGWDSEGGHRNYGPRTYSTSKAFINDVLHSEKKSFIKLTGN